MTLTAPSRRLQTPTPQASRRRYRVADSTTPSREKSRHGFVAVGKLRYATADFCKKLTLVLSVRRFRHQPVKLAHGSSG